MPLLSAKPSMRWGLALGTSPWAHWPSNNRFERSSFNNRSLWKPYLPLSLAPGTERRGKKKRTICKVLAKSQAQWIGKNSSEPSFTNHQKKRTLGIVEVQNMPASLLHLGQPQLQRKSNSQGAHSRPSYQCTCQTAFIWFPCGRQAKPCSVPAGNRYSPVHVRNMHVWHQRKN